MKNSVNTGSNPSIGYGRGLSMKYFILANCLILCNMISSDNSYLSEFDIDIGPLLEPLLGFPTDLNY